MKKNILIVLITLLWPALTIATYDPEKIKLYIEQTLPDTVLDDVLPVPNYPGYFAVLTRNDLFFFHQPTKMLISGELIDLEQKKNVSLTTREMVYSLLYQQIPTERAMIIQKGTGSRQAILFTDPNCHYCHNMEKELRGINDIKVSVLPIPVLGYRSEELLKNIFCQNNIAEAWDQWISSKKIPPKPKNCPYSRFHFQIFHYWAQKFGVRSVPAIVFPSGKMLMGFQSKDRLETLLTSEQAASVSK